MSPAQCSAGGSGPKLPVHGCALSPDCLPSTLDSALLRGSAAGQASFPQAVAFACSSPLGDHQLSLSAPSVMLAPALLLAISTGESQLSMSL